MQRSVLLPVLLLMLLPGCVVSPTASNGFQQFYEGAPDARALPQYDVGYQIPNNVVPIQSSSNIEADTQRLLEQGFVPFGHSSFHGPDGNADMRQLQAQARKLGAHVVLFNSSHLDTVTGALPMTMPNNSASYTSGSASAYGSGGYGMASGNSVTNTYSTTTAIVPYSVDRSNFNAVYFAKKHARLGIVDVVLTDAERQQLQTNSAVKVKAVIQDTPAFAADVLAGDFILAINSDPVSNNTNWGAALEKYKGQDVTLHIIRNGRELMKKVHINQ